MMNAYRAGSPEQAVPLENLRQPQSGIMPGMMSGGSLFEQLMKRQQNLPQMGAPMGEAAGAIGGGVMGGAAGGWGMPGGAGGSISRGTGTLLPVGGPPITSQFGYKGGSMLGKMAGMMGGAKAGY